jgi:regulation of enolase protein 1 (concanavalin A-like superfamily)
MIRFDSSELQWLNNPTSWGVDDTSGEQEGSNGDYLISDNGNSLTLLSPAKKDFWRRTYYEPLLIKSDAPGLLYDIPPFEEATICIDFTFNPISQFDQVQHHYKLTY